MPYYIAIDGGGTKTEGLLCTGDGGILRRAVEGSSNPNDIGIEKSCARLLNVVGELASALPDGAAVSSLFAGISGATGNAAMLTDALAASAQKVRVGSDAVNLLSCAGSGDGICLISGTGSVCFVRAHGEIRRIGGWGYLIDGAGSGYDIGRDAVSAVLCAYDGRGRATALTAILEKKLGKRTADAIPEIYRGGKSFIASLAPAVFEAAREGDGISCDILDRNAAYLAGLLSAAADVLRPCSGGRHRAVLGGSIVTAPDGLFPRLCAIAPPDIELIRTDAPPVYGAFCEALSADGREADAACRRRFLDDYRSITK